MGCILDDNWLFAQWPKNFVNDCNPSIKYLELFALVVGVLTWQEKLTHKRFIIFCDNQAVVGMMNKLASSCKFCMKLIRLLVLNNLQFNRRITIKYVNTKRNETADALSHLDLKYFRRVAPHMKPTPEEIDERIWPVTKLW